MEDTQCTAYAFVMLLLFTNAKHNCDLPIRTSQRLENTHYFVGKIRRLPNAPYKSCEHGNGLFENVAVNFPGQKNILPVAATAREFNQNFDAALAAFDVQRMYALSQYMYAATNALIPIFSYISPVRESGTQCCTRLKWSLCFNNTSRQFLHKHFVNKTI